MTKWIKIFVSREEALLKLEEKKPFTVSINNLRICLVKYNDEISAFKSQCPHAGASLSEGFINQLSEIVCPMHGYRFSLIDGRETSGKSCELSLYAIELKDDGLFIALRQ